MIISHLHTCCKHGFYIFISHGITGLPGIKKEGERFSVLYRAYFLLPSPGVHIPSIWVF